MTTTNSGNAGNGMDKPQLAQRAVAWYELLESMLITRRMRNILRQIEAVVVRGQIPKQLSVEVSDLSTRYERFRSRLRCKYEKVWDDHGDEVVATENKQSYHPQLLQASVHLDKSRLWLERLFRQSCHPDSSYEIKYAGTLAKLSEALVATKASLTMAHRELELLPRPTIPRDLNIGETKVPGDFVI